METTFSRALKVVSGKGQEGTYRGSFIVGNLASIEVDSSAADVDSTSLQVEWKLLGNYLQEGLEGSFLEMTNYQNTRPVDNCPNKSGSFSETPFCRALKVVSGKWQEGSYSFVIGNLAEAEGDHTTTDVSSASLQ